MADVIQRIKQKLAYLREHEDFDDTDAEMQRHRADHHRYELNPPHTEEQLAVFEAQYEFRFPEDYRRFVLAIGASGAGPGYYLLSPLNDLLSQADSDYFFDHFYDEDADEDDYWKEDAPVIGDLKSPFPFTETMTLGMTNALIGTLVAQQGWTVVDRLLSAGYLEIADAGGPCWYLLIVSGQSAGQIWYVDGGTIFAPVMLANGKLFQQPVLGNMPIPANAERITFTQWYEAWLNEEITLAQNHWQQRGRTVPVLILTEND